MNLVQVYSGNYVTAKSASSVLDIDAIFRGCDAVDSEAEEISGISSTISSAGSSITRDVLAVDDRDMTETISECSTEVLNARENILSVTASIREAAIDAYNKIQNNYNIIAQARREAISEHSKSSKNS